MRTYLDAPDGWTCRQFAEGTKLFVVFRSGTPASEGIGFVTNLAHEGQDRWFYGSVIVAGLPHWLGPGYPLPGPAIDALIAHATDQEVTQ